MGDTATTGYPQGGALFTTGLRIGRQFAIGIFQDEFIGVHATMEHLMVTNYIQNTVKKGLMHQINLAIGGRPGIDCNGFCYYCYHQHVQNTPLLGCRHCSPEKIGCSHCAQIFRPIDQKFKSPWLLGAIAQAEILRAGKEDCRIYIMGDGDPSCHPKFKRLIEIISSLGVPFSIGYTTGKGFTDPEMGRFLVNQGLSTIVFSIFSTDPRLLQKYILDPNPDATLSVLEYLCGEIRVIPTIIVVPGINDGVKLDETCGWLEERGAKGLIVFRFANIEEQGIIRGNAPIVDGQKIQPVEEFNDLIRNLSQKYHMRIDSMPFWDPASGSPFLITDRPDYLSRLPRIHRRATVITGSIAAPALQRILDACGGPSLVVPARKDIACLITAKDLRNLDPEMLEETIIIPGRALVQNREAVSILSSDTCHRTVVRGPDTLTSDQELWDVSRRDALNAELSAFSELIRLINEYGN
jgi:methanogenesis marker radical SAM protein